MKFLRLSLMCTEPVRIADDNTSQNGQTDTMCYIPGSTIRGMVLSQLCRDKKYFDQNKKLLFSDHIIFMNAYLNANGKELIPSIKGFYEDKRTFSGKKGIENSLMKKDLSGMKRAALGQYCYIEDACIYYTSAKICTDLNINRGKEEKKNVFRSQYLDRNQKFTGYIGYDEQVDTQLTDRIKNIFSKQIYLGGNRSSGYGACECSIEMADTVPYFSLKNARGGDQVYMLLLSNLAMRNSCGEIVGLDLEQMASKLGCEELKLVHCATSVTEVRGYNRNYKGHIPSVPVYAAGSVFCIKANTPILESALRKLEQEGLGIRKNEGFGQIAFYDNYEEIKYKMPLNKTPSQTTETLLDDLPCNTELEDIRIAAAGLLDYRIKCAMTQYVVRNPLPTEGVSNSQLGVICALCQELQYKPDMAEKKLREYLRHASDKDSGKRIHDGKKSKGELFGVIQQILDTDLNAIFELDKSGNMIFGMKIRELLTADDEIRYKMKLIIEQIRYQNREGKDHADSCK